MFGYDSHQYRPLDASTWQSAHTELRDRDDNRRTRLLHPSTRRMMALFAVLLAASGFWCFGYPRSSTAFASNTDEISQSWGSYSPYFPVPSEIDNSVPDGCNVTLAVALHRHGARYPTQSKWGQYNAIMKRMRTTVQDYRPGFEFLRLHRFTLKYDELTRYGEQETYDSGAAFLKRYEALAQEDEPFIRASGSHRVIVSAQKFSEGFYHAQGKDGGEAKKKILVLPEGYGSNNTLDQGGCPAYDDADISQRKLKAWNAVWLSRIIDRLNQGLPGLDLTLEETVRFMELCPFETVASSELRRSKICGLFSAEEWQDFDYLQSLRMWYAPGPGNPLGPTTGAGYVNELIARLTGEAVHDHTTTNSTLDSSPNTFPLHRKLYVDFSHDVIMTSIYGALGLYNLTDDLPVKTRLSPSQTHGYSASWTVPFAARMFVEKHSCGQGEEELVRVLVNDRVTRLIGCHADELGRCKLGAFVKSLSFARAGGHWQSCFE